MIAQSALPKRAGKRLFIGAAGVGTVAWVGMNPDSGKPLGRQAPIDLGIEIVGDRLVVELHGDWRANCLTRQMSSTSKGSWAAEIPKPPTSVSPRSRSRSSFAQAYGVKRRGLASGLVFIIGRFSFLEAGGTESLSGLGWSSQTHPAEAVIALGTFAGAFAAQVAITTLAGVVTFVAHVRIAPLAGRPLVFRHPVAAVVAGGPVPVV